MEEMVSTNEMDAFEISHANACDVLTVDKDGLGFVPRTWLDRTRERLAAARNAQMDAMKIIINCKRFVTVPGDEVSYEHIVRLAGMSGHPSMTVRYPDGRGVMPTPGDAVKLEDGTIISVQHTGNA